MGWEWVSGSLLLFSCQWQWSCGAWCDVLNKMGCARCKTEHTLSVWMWCARCALGAHGKKRHKCVAEREKPVRKGNKSYGA